MKSRKLSFLEQLRNTFLPHRTNGGHPHVLRQGIVVCVVGLVIAIEFASLYQSINFPRSTQQLASILPGVVIALTNQQRSSDLLSGLTSNALLTQAAQAAANDMAQKGYFSHVNPEGKLPWYWLNQVGYQYQYAGENLAVNFDDSSRLVDAWMQSPTHRANILGANFSEIGVGMATGTYEGKEAIFVVQFFASPIESHAPAAVVATATTQPRTPAPISTKENKVITKPLVKQPITTVASVATQNATSAPAILGVNTSNNKVSLRTRILSSPYTYATDALMTLATFFLLSLVVGLLPFSRRLPHPRALANGVALVVVLVAVIILNQRVLFSSISLPADTQNASVSIAAQSL